MRLAQKVKGDVVVCNISGEINIDTIENLNKIFKKIVEGNSRKVLFNLKDVEYIDSSGFACLVKLSRDLSAIQGVLFFSNISPKIRSLFAIIKLDRAFKIYETEDEALKDFSGH